MFNRNLLRNVFCILVLWLCVPDSYTAQIKILGVSPIYFVTGLLSVLGLLLSDVHKVLRTPMFLFAAVCLMAMSLKGFFAAEAPPYSSGALFAYDFLVVLSLLAGIAIGASWSISNIYTLLSLPASIAAIATVATCVGLAVGFIEPLASDRLYTGSLFASAEFALVAGPLLQGSVALDSRRARRPGAKYLGLICSTIGLAAGIFSATRSMFISGALSVVVSSVPIIRLASPAKRFAASALALILLLAVSIGPGLSIFDNSVLARLRGTDVTNEIRYEEVNSLFAEMKDDIWIGKGLGSYFNSPIAALYGELASGPHVGLLTPYQKGGIFGAFGIFGWPLLVTLRSLLFRLRDADAWARASSAAVLFTLAAMSGGWHYLVLFVTGLSLGQQVGISRARTRAVVFATRSRGMQPAGPDALYLHGSSDVVIFPKQHVSGQTR